jgi:EmrB/QacA subfamily drug resistance transporter
MKTQSIPTHITTLVASVIFMEMLDATIIATALPQMARSLNASPVSLNIGISAYLLTLAVFIPVSGWVADRFGSRSVFASAIGIFTVASVCCGVSTTLTQFLLMRILQGIGGAMMVPVGRLIVLRISPKESLTEALNRISWPGLSALVVGPPLGGLIVTYASWHWIFFINLPIGIIALLLAYQWIANERGELKSPFDWQTFMLGGLASAGTVYAMEALGADASRWHVPAAVLAGSLLFGVVAVRLARRHPDRSLIAFKELKLRSYSLGVGGASLFRIGIAGLPLLLSLMLQTAFGFSALRAGLYLVIFFAGDLSMKAFVVRILGRFGFRAVIVHAGMLTAATIAACAILSPSTPFVVVLMLFFLHGAFRSLQLSAISSVAFSEVGLKSMGRANSFLSAISQLSSGMGVATGAVALRLFAFAGGQSTGSPPLSAYHYAILVLAILTLGSVGGGWRLAHDAGAEIISHRRSIAEAASNPE